MYSTNDSSVYRIEPLKGDTNYLVWKVKMEDILSDLGLINYVEGRLTKPATDSSGWETNDRRALSAIRLRVSDTIISYIRTSKTSKEAWTALSNRFEPKGTSAIVAARRRLLSTRWEEGTDITDFINTNKSRTPRLSPLDAITHKNRVRAADRVALLTPEPNIPIRVVRRKKNSKRSLDF